MLTLLFLAGLGCCVWAAAIWLWAPDTGRPPLALVAPTAPPDVPRLARHHKPPRHVPPAEDEPALPAAPTRVAAAAAAGGSELGEPHPAVPARMASAEVSSAPPDAAGEHHGQERPRLAIIIDDCGQWPVTERGFMALPFPLTLSVLPHVRYGSTIAREASAAGKGVMLHLPMETVSGRYPGPGTITTEMNDAAIRTEVQSDLVELPEARGVNNHEGSLATADSRVMNDVADVLVRDGRFFIDSRTSSASVAEAVARTRGVPSAGRNVFLDNVDDEAAVEDKLREAVEYARTYGSAIAIGHPRPATLAAVRDLAPKFSADGVQFILASDLVH